MSALGQKQTFAPQNFMSALPPKATSNATYGNVRFGPIADIVNVPLASFRSTYQKRWMGRQAVIVLYVLALIAVVVGVDVLFFRNRFWERLMVNVGIVLVFAAFYLRFLKR